LKKSLYLKNISSCSSKVGASFGHDSSGEKGVSIVDVESTGSSTNLRGSLKWGKMTVND
jgi:hypothetical protein